MLLAAVLLLVEALLPVLLLAVGGALVALLAPAPLALTILSP